MALNRFQKKAAQANALADARATLRAIAAIVADEVRCNAEKVDSIAEAIDRYQSKGN